MQSRVLASATLLTSFLLSGCGSSDGIQRVIVNGSVTLKNQPVEDGQIRFVPQVGTDGPVTIEPIQGGKYTCERNGGVPAGTHRVEILAWDPTVPAAIGPGQPPRPQWVSPKFNRDSTLTVIIDSNESPVTKDFEVN
jgi:hypothetical protein